MGNTFKDKVVIVTGGANGIGRCIASEFRSQGAVVYVTDKLEVRERLVKPLESYCCSISLKRFPIKRLVDVSFDFGFSKTLPLPELKSTIQVQRELNNRQG